MNADRASLPHLLAPETAPMELSPELVSELLDPAAWTVALDRFARTMKLAVVLTDVTGRMLGECHNPQAIWSLARAKRPPDDGECPFCLMPRVPCTSINDALRSGEPVLNRDQLGYVHVTAPILLGDRTLGTLIAGQAFDQYPEQLPVERLARKYGLAPQQVWQIAQKRYPISRKTMHVYGELLLTLGQTFVQARYGAVLGRARQAERERAAQAEHLANELADADRRKNEFIAILAHEIRNPLAAIANASRLAAGPDAAHTEWANEVILRQVGMLTRLTDDLLDISRIAQGKIQLQKELLDVRTVIERSVEVVRPLIAERAHQLDIFCPEQSVSIYADPTRLEQVFTNLLTNAAKYTDRGGHISLSAEPTGDHCIVKLSDSGMGIAPRMLPRIFEVYSQVDESLQHSRGGLGIGLSLVKSLVELQGGSVSAASEGEGHGSEFTVRLPMSTSGGSQIASNPTAQVASDGKRDSKSRLLVVDDDVDTAKSMGLLLTISGHDVEVAHHGRAAIEIARAFQPNVVLLDIGLPGRDGYQIAEQLRNEPWCRDALLIAVSGYGQAEDHKRSKAAGFDYHLTKPINYEELRTLISGAH
jgi:signal transduction histidine kinase/CheY-like chemotaxis protein